MLGSIVLFQFATAIVVGCSLLNSAHSLDVYKITFLVYSHICGQRKKFMFYKRPREYVMGPSSLSSLFVILTDYWRMVILAKVLGWFIV